MGVGEGAKSTGLDDVDTDVLDTEIDLFLYEGGGDLVDVLDAEGVLGGQGRGGGHCVAFVGRDHFLISFETTAIS